MSERRKLLITGNSSGIGYGLSREYLTRGWTVYGLSRRGCAGLSGDLHDVRCDLSDFDAIGPALRTLLSRVDQLDLVVLNAGVLGDIRELHETGMDDIKRVMDINLWANKVLMDWLHKSGMPVRQVVMMSSGAAVNGSKGWSGYALSKAALNMLAKLYAHEFPEAHISAFAPGLVHTQMQNHIRDNVDSGRFPSAQRLKDAMGTAQMPDAESAAERLMSAFSRLPDYPSGSFLDIRTMGRPNAP